MTAASPLDRVLRFKQHLRPEPLDAERVFLLGECERFMLQGRVYRLLVPLIDGRRTVGEQLAALAPHVPTTEVFYALTHLEERGYLTEAPGTPGPQAAFWESLGLDAARVAQHLEATPVTVRALGGEPLEPLVGALKAAGLRVREEAEARVHVLLVDDDLAPGLEEWNREALRRGLRWMTLKLHGLECHVGPMFQAPRGPCWECLATRLRRNRPVEAYLERYAGSTCLWGTPRSASPAGAA
ncbi:MAG TPA: TOMM precursor leader peptide-binding protein, partial [Archangium sp.]